jgi:hypothetical protein
MDLHDGRNNALTTGLTSAASKTDGRTFMASMRGSRTGFVLQRKCDCGQHTGGGECEECKKNGSSYNSSGDSLLRRSASKPIRTKVVPSIVHDVLRSSGAPLDVSTRAYFEPRFSRDFSGVRVHSGEHAAASAKAVGASAYTVGRNIVFAGRYDPTSSNGRKLLAHELTHVLQQSEAPASAMPKIGSPDDGFEQEASEMERLALGGTGSVNLTPKSDRGFLRRLSSPTQVSPLPPRGTNPSVCMAPQCAQIAKSTAPSTNDKAAEMADQWLSQAKSCITSGASGSNASHQAEIAQHESDEMDAEAVDLKKNWSQRPKSSFANAEFLKWLGDTCKRRQRQVEIEFRYNILFENPPGGLQWDPSPSNWDPIESALAALPDEATWTNPRLLKFRRAACHPDDVDPNTGACTGQAAGPFRSFTGGETKRGTGEITIYNAGLDPQPFSRSAKLGLSASSQTIRHEVGHVIADLDPDKKIQFFEKIVDWIDYPWAWISPKKPPYDNWRAEKNKLKAELGFDDAQLDAWLAALQVGHPIVAGSRTYVRNGNFLQSVPTSNLPAGVEFEYARSSQDEYLAELYALAASNPEFIHNAVPFPQVRWLKTEVFHTQQAIEEVSRQAAVGEPLLSEFLQRARVLFTVQQLRAALDEVLRKPRARTGTIA